MEMPLTLLPLKFEPLPLGSIKPLGWMQTQLHLMADGLPGHLHEFYRLVKDAPWLGGDQEYSPLNEAWPYWYNGLVPLAYAIDDARLRNELLQVTGYVLDHQFEDGWLGPEADLRRRNFWGRYPLLLGLAQLVEVADSETSAKILDAIHRFVKLMHSMLEDDYQGYVSKAGDDFDEQWGRSRAADMILFLQWLLEKHPRDNTERIHQSMLRLHEKAHDWSHWFSEEVYIKADLDTLPESILGPLFPFVHVVNAAQGLKAGAVVRRLTLNDSLLRSVNHGVEWTFQYHGTPSGAIIGDERLSGLSPTRGTELCSVVELMYSLTYLYQAIGDAQFADRAELAAYNALPVMSTPDEWAHQYVAQTNQPFSHQLDNQPFWNVGPKGQIYGVEPNYPCCTVNSPQGLPKFLSSSFVATSDRGLAHAILMPAEVTTTLGEDNDVHVSCDTKYPFAHSLRYTITTANPFRFEFRVPNWASTVSLSIDEQEQQYIDKLDPVTQLCPVEIMAGTTQISVNFTTDVRVENRANDTISIYHGALLYALPVPAKYSAARPEHYPGGSAPQQARDWTIAPKDDNFRWNMAVDPSTLELDSSMNEHLQTSPGTMWDPEKCPYRIKAMACELANWQLTSPTRGWAPEPPSLDQRRCVGKPFQVELLPYGALKIHMAEFPVINLQGQAS